MRAINLYLHIHQPFRYREYAIFETGQKADYFDERDPQSLRNNRQVFLKVAQKSYHPMLDLLERNLRKYPEFRFSLSITGVWLEQAEAWAPDLVRQLQRMVATGRVEIVAETFYHSLAFFYNRAEFEAQVKQHQAKIQEVFGVKTAVFRNTELSYRDDLAVWAEGFGFKGILAEGWDKILGWRSPNHVYRPAGCEKLRLLLKNYRLSDDIAFRFSNRGWSEWPLTVEKYLKWLEMDCLRGNLINLFMDFETFGEHQWEDTGIFRFIERLIYVWLQGYENKFVTVSEACDLEEPVDEISMPEIVTWADSERDLSAWTGNAMQDEGVKWVYDLREKVLATGDAGLIEDWRRMTTSDHAYYLCTKYWNDGDVHAYFSAYDSPYTAFMYYMNVLRDIERRAERLSAKLG